MMTLKGVCCGGRAIGPTFTRICGQILTEPVAIKYGDEKFLVIIRKKIKLLILIVVRIEFY